MTDEERVVLAAMLEDVRSDLPLADQKASFTLAGLGVGVGAALGGLLAGDWTPKRLADLPATFFWIGVVAIVAAIVCAGVAVWPRTGADDALSEDIYYWRHVARYKDVAALTSALSTSVPGDLERTTYQLWNLSTIVQHKYNFIRWALFFAGLGLIAFAVAGCTQ